MLWRTSESQQGWWPRLPGVNFLPVQAAYESLLQASLDEEDQEVHNGLWHCILQVLAHYVKVAFHEQASHFHLDLLLLGSTCLHSECLQQQKHQNYQSM